jgi:hypothetical protein
LQITCHSTQSPLRQQVGIVTLKDRTIRPPVQTFIDSCRSLAAQVAKRAS